MAQCQVGGYLSHPTDLGKPKGVHFMPKEQYDSMASTDCVIKAGKASFSARRHIPRMKNDEWYVLEAVHSSKVSVGISGEDNDEHRYV
jgi:hypothetical protein